MKKTKAIVNKIVVGVLTALLSIALLPGRTLAAEGIESIEPSAGIDTNRKGSLTLTHKDVDDEFVPDVASHIYLIATVDANGIYTITDEFKGFFDDQNFFNNGYNYDKWKDCVQHSDEGGSNTGALEGYIETNSISEVKSGISDSKGETLYDNLDLGVYFVKSDDKVFDDYTDSFINFVYPVPILEKPETGGNLVINYNPSASPKKSRMDGVTHCGIRKLWVDSGNTDRRPASVTFEIYSDGKYMETVTLSSENSWYHEWSDEGIHSYEVKEISVVPGYVSNIAVQPVGEGAHNFIYTCTNTYTPPGDNPPPPDNPPGDTPPSNTPPSDTPPSDTPPGNPGGDQPGVLGAIRNLPAVLGARRLPQTGLLWWPVPVLVIAGVAFIVKGIKKSSKNKA